MQCQKLYPRDLVQKWMSELNAGWSVDNVGEMRPDGDMVLPDGSVNVFKIPHCPDCGPGTILKTDVVFFGDNIPGTVFNECRRKFEEASGLLVLGSSLAVLSGYRFVQDAYMRDLPIVIVNIGPTRGDHLATLKVEARCSEVATLVTLPLIEL